MAWRRVRKELADYMEQLNDRGISVSFEGDNQFTWLVRLRGGCVRIRFPSDYPFEPPKLEAAANEEGNIIPLQNLVGFRPRLLEDQWSPVLHIPKLLLESPAPKELTLKFLLEVLESLADGYIVLISVGCGGPIVRQKYPPAMQALRMAGNPLCLVMVDPCLFNRDECALSQDDLPVIGTAVQSLRTRHCTVHVIDHRGASFGGVSYPLERVLPSDNPNLPIDDAGTIARDSIIDDIFAVTLGETVDIDDELLNVVGNVGNAILGVMSNGGSRGSSTRASMDHRIVALEGGMHQAKAKRLEKHTF